MNNAKHEWCQDVPRDEAVRAAEDAAAVPAILHRDLPDAVAELRERVARLEAVIPKSVSGSSAGEAEAEQAAPAGAPSSPADGLRTERVTLDVRHRSAVSIRQWPWRSLIAITHGESVCVVEETEAMKCMTKLRRERDAARAECERLRARVAELERECDAAKEECEDLRRKKNYNDRVLWAKVDCAEARVAELEAASAAPPEPRGWLTAEERDAVGWIVQFARHHAVPSAAVAHCNIETFDALLARSSPPRVKVPNLREQNTWRSRDDQWIDAIRAAGGEVEG